MTLKIYTSKAGYWLCAVDRENRITPLGCYETELQARSAASAIGAVGPVSVVEHDAPKGRPGLCV